MQPAPSQLSSRQTFVIKVLYPVCWIGVFGAIAFASPPGAEARARWVVLGLLIAFTLFLSRSYMGLKRVRMDDRALYVSNYVKAIVVPLADVAGVSEHRWFRIHPVTITLHRETEFGRRIVFMPKVRWLRYGSPHPVVDEIQAAVARAKGPGPGDVAA